MMVVITYDVNTESLAGRRRLRKVAKRCTSYGQRVQCSVFECLVDAAQLTQLKHQLVELIDPQKDSLRFYHLGDKWSGRVEHVGAKASIDLAGPLVA